MSSGLVNDSFAYMRLRSVTLTPPLPPAHTLLHSIPPLPSAEITNIKPSVDSLSSYVIYMSFHIQPSSVENYLSGI